MKRLTAALTLGAVAALVAVSQARAQASPYIYAAGGVNIPVSTFKDAYKTGWIASAGIGADVGNKGLFVEAEGWYGSNKSKLTGGPKINLWSALAAVGYSFTPAKSWSPYLLGGAGAIHGTGGKTKFAYSGALGATFKAGSTVHVFIEGRWLASTGTGAIKMIPVTAGVTISFGKKKM